MKKIRGIFGLNKNAPGEPAAQVPKNCYEIREKDLPKIHKAAWQGDAQKVKQLAKKDVNQLDKEKRTALHLAVAFGHKDVVEALLEWKAKTNILDDHGKSPLIKGIECGQDECVHVLLDQSSDLELADAEKNTPLHVAVREGNQSLVKLLIDQGAKLNSKNVYGFTPLIVSALDTNKRDDLARLLLQSGADPNITDNCTRSALHHACSEDCINHVKLLLHYKANTSMKDNKGWTAEDCAMMKGNHGCAQLLFDHNLRLRKQFSGSLPSTPRVVDSLPASSASTPRPGSQSEALFGLPQAPIEDGNESDDQTVSKEMSAPADNRQDSWADDTDISSAMDDHKKKVATKFSLVKNVRLDDSDAEGDTNQKLTKEGTKSPGSLGESVRPVYSRTPTPDSRKSPSSPVGVGSKISARKLSDDYSYEEASDEEDDSAPQQRNNKVSFKEEQEIRNIDDESATDDDTDVEDPDDELEEVEPAKKRRIEPKEESDVDVGYIPSIGGSAGSGMSPEKFKAMMKDMGMEELSDVDTEEISDHIDSPHATTSQLSTPRGILKIKDTGKPPSVQRVESDEDDSEWDSTKQSDTPRSKGQGTPRDDSIRVESPNTEYDSDIEGTLNPDVSAKDRTSQWDSSEENYTPRTPRNLDLLQDTSPNVISYDESEVVEEVEDAMTSFITQPIKTAARSPATPDSSQARSHDSPDLYSSNNSIQKTVVQVSQTRREVEEDEEEDNEYDWDSDAGLEDEDVEEPEQAKGSYLSPHQTPRGHSSSHMTDEESVSEWELERNKEKEAKEKLAKERKEQEENLRRLMEEEDEAQRVAEEEEEQQIREEEEMQRQEDEQMREEERRKLAELEEEEERQRQWEEEERRRKKQLEREVQAELEREKQEAEDSSEGTDFSDFSEHDAGVLPDNARPIDRADVAEPAHASPRSEGQPRSQDSEHSNPSFGSQKGRELKKPPPKLVVKQFFQPHKEDKNPIKIGEIENESPVPVQSTQNGSQYRSPPPAFGQSGNQPEVKDNSDDEIEEIDNEVEALSTPVDLIEDTSLIPANPPVEEVVAPVKSSQVSAAVSKFSARTELASTNGYQPSHVESHLPSNNPPPLPTSAPPGGKAMSLQSDGNSADEDDLDPYLDKQERSSFNLPDFSGNTGLYTSGLDPFEDDGLSVTSTENGDISSSYRPDNLPYGKDMLVNMNLNDSHAVLKLQEHLREHRGQLEQERNQRMLLENKQKLVTKEKADLEKTIGSLKYQKSALEQSKLDLEAKIRTIEYNVAEEEEKRKNAEMLLNKTKDHLAKKEEQFTFEMEAKQRAELQMRNLQSELRSAQNLVKELEEEKEELDRLLTNEKNARQLQEKINEEQQRLQQHMQDESLKFSSQRDGDGDESQSALELADGDIKAARDMLEKYKNEIVALKAELQRQRSRLTEENSMLASENEKLSQRIEDLKNEVKLNEEALTQLTVQQNIHQSKLSSDAAMLNNALEKEQAAREKMEAELESAKTRLQVTTIQLEKAQQARNDFERRLHSDREEWGRQLERKDQELSKLYEKIQTDMHQANSLETRLNAVESELNISNTSLLEKSNQLQQSQRELQHYKGLHENYDTNLRTEKDRCSKLQIKIDSLNERLTTMQHENLSLRQLLETAHSTATERSGLDLQQKLDHMISNLKADHDKARHSLEEKNNNLQDTISHLREEVRNAENRRSNMEQDLRRMNQEQNDLIRKLSIAEASLDVASKARDNLEQERLALKMEVEKMQQKYQASQERTIESQTRMNELISRLDQTEQSRILSHQQLADTSANMQAFSSSKAELEESYQKLQVDNVRLEAELKHERQKSEMLQRDLADTQKVRSSLEALCSNLKSTNAHLEEKLGPGQLREVTASIAQLDRQKQETAAQLEEEKRKTRKALEQKRLAETKLEGEQEKVGNLQKEVANLKAYLKVAKKKLKDPEEASDTNQTRFSTLHSAFDHERNAMEEMLISVKSQSNVETGYTEKSSLEEAKREIEARYRSELNRKLDEVNNYLDEQARTRSRLDSSREEQESKLRHDRKKMEEELTDLRIKYEQTAAQKETAQQEMRRYRDLYETEMQWRMKLSEQLYRSTDKTHQLKNSMLAERQRSRLYGSLTNLSVNGHTLDLSRINGSLADDALSNKLKAELDRSIAKHLEAAPHDTIRPYIRTEDPILSSSNFAKANADYMEVLKRKYCV